MKRQVVLSMVALSLLSCASNLTVLAEPSGPGSESKTRESQSRENQTKESQAKDVQAKEQKRPLMDLAFCIDTTGSMQNEIDQVKTKVKSLVAKLAAGKPAPIVRVGMVAYRDRGDAYVVKSYAFTDDIDQFVKDVSDLKAAGGGDGPEAVNQGLHAAINDLKWSSGKDTAKLMFLIGDAPPNTYKGDYSWSDEAKHAIASGIQINTIACAGLESYPQSQGVDTWRQIAKLADGQFDMLTYHAETVNAKGEKETVISSAGATYKVKSSASADWKSGLGSLLARGAVDKMSDSDMPFSGAKSASMGAYMSAAGRASRAFARPLAAPMAGAGGAPGAAFASESFARSRADGASYNSVGRGDSNLDDIMVSAARERAKKVLKVDYGH